MQSRGNGNARGPAVSLLTPQLRSLFWTLSCDLHYLYGSLGRGVRRGAEPKLPSVGICLMSTFQLVISMQILLSWPPSVNPNLKQCV